MKRSLFVFVTVLFLVALLAMPSSTFAAADATCQADPPSGPVGTTFVITCWGFDPNARVYAYLVEPDGTATITFASGTLKANESGYVTYTQETRFDNVTTLGVGTWVFVVEQLGLAKSVVHRGEVAFTVTGGSEGVSGAWLSADPSSITKPEVGHDHLQFGSITVNFGNPSDPVTITGWGFAPYEMVTFWYDPPNGECSSFTAHYNYRASVNLPPIVVAKGTLTENFPAFDGLGSTALATVKADGAGNVTMEIFFYYWACEGRYRVVGRGNTSGKGAYTWVTLTGNSVSTNAWLYADPTSVTGLFDRVQFSGGGFWGGERVDCWLTSPQGRVVAFPEDSFVTGSDGIFSQRDIPITADAGGNIAFEMVTGSYYLNDREGGTISGVPYQISREFFDPIQSEGALGRYAMTCRGFSSGNTAIAWFTITGGPVDP